MISFKDLTRVKLFMLILTALFATVLWSYEFNGNTNTIVLEESDSVQMKKGLQRDSTAFVSIQLAASNNQNILGTSVVLTNADSSNYYCEPVSNENGYAYFWNVELDTYNIYIEQNGFMPYAEEGFVVNLTTVIHPLIVLQEFPYPPSALQTQQEPQAIYLSWRPPLSAFPGYTPSVTYTIWRANINTIGNEQTWSLIVDNLSDEYFTDTSWANAPLGQYKYILKAKYPNNYYSEPIFSDIEANYSTVTIPFETDDDRSPQGASARMIGLDNNYDETEYVDEGYTIFYNVPYGEYNIFIGKDGYYGYDIEQVMFYEPEHVVDPIVLSRNPYPPTNIVAESQIDFIELTWQEPGPGVIWHRSDPPLLFTVWRSDSENRDNSEAWDLLAEDITDWSYIDNEKVNLPAGMYFYYVSVKYSDSIISEPGESNPVYSFLGSYVYIPVNTNIGVSANGALVTLTNLEYPTIVYTTVVDDGVAIFQDVEGGMYDILVTKEGYYPEQIEGYYVWGDDELDPITINAMDIQPLNVEASIYKSSVKVEWNPPVDQDNNPITMEFAIYRFKSEDINNTNNWQLLQELIEDVFYYDNSWYAAEPGTYQYAVKAIFSEEFASEPAYSNTVIKGAISNVMVRLATDDNQSPDGAKVTLINTDNDPEHIYEAISSNHAGFFTNIPFGTYNIIAEKTLYYTKTIESVLINTAVYEYPTITLERILYPPSNVTATINNDAVLISWQKPITDGSAFSNSNRSRSSIYYSVLRSTEEDVENENAWILLESNINTTSYTDETWSDLDFDSYVYMVKAHYTEELISPPSISNTLNKDPISHVIVSLGTANQSIVPGALITLTNQDNDPLHVYTNTSSADSMTVHFPEVWYGTYTLTVEKEGYITVSQQDIEIGQPIYYHPFIIMQEFPYPPTNVVAVAQHEQVNLTWDEPQTLSNSTLSYYYTIWRAKISE
ncbi:MAG: carboxypeptidase-like regulatory domain-containing protein, partial [Candidatus Cloacimonadales bacterium]|nr:carboxypeptidase-like regulatory domain-containing protein [Candidatus Cloacimonadales bacterium]